MIEQEENLKSYLENRGVPCGLEKGELPLAVIWPTRAADQRSLRELGKLLLVWKMQNPGVKNILGLERLREGRWPEVSVLLLMIPFCPAKPETCVEKVALVVVDDSQAQKELISSLCDVIEGSGAAMVSSWEQFSYMNR